MEGRHADSCVDEAEWDDEEAKTDEKSLKEARLELAAPEEALMAVRVWGELRRRSEVVGLLLMQPWPVLQSLLEDAEAEESVKTETEEGDAEEVHWG